MDDSPSSWGTVVLAAGRGSRMRSATPKVLHSVAGWPMVRHVVEAALQAGSGPCVVVVGPGISLPELGGSVSFVTQDAPLGTGHAVAQAQTAIPGATNILVLNGDVPLITPLTLQRLMAEHLQREADLTFLTARVDDAGEYGVVERDAHGGVAGLFEASERGPIEGPAEINSGQYCFRSSWLWPRLGRLPKASTGEYYLTALIAEAVREHARLYAMPAGSFEEVQGVNNRAQLADVERAMRSRINEEHMLHGVTFIDPSTSYVDASVEIGVDSLVEPNVQLLGATSVGDGCRIGSGARIQDATIGNHCNVVASTIEQAVLEESVDIGPYSHIRAGSHLCRGVHIGNYAEIKNARLGPGVKMGHFSYIGDAEVGDDTNIGAGSITCNFDGRTKHRTVIGKRVFIGSATKLVAPVEIGDDARTGAGSVVTKNVPPGSLAVGAPARIMKGNQ